MQSCGRFAMVGVVIASLILSGCKDAVAEPDEAKVPTTAEVKKSVQNLVNSGGRCQTVTREAYEASMEFASLLETMITQADSTMKNYQRYLSQFSEPPAALVLEYQRQLEEYNGQADRIRDEWEPALKEYAARRSESCSNAEEASLRAASLVEAYKPRFSKLYEQIERCRMQIAALKPKTEAELSAIEDDDDVAGRYKAARHGKECSSDLVKVARASGLQAQVAAGTIVESVQSTSSEGMDPEKVSTTSADAQVPSFTIEDGCRWSNNEPLAGHLVELCAGAVSEANEQDGNGYSYAVIETAGAEVDYDGDGDSDRLVIIETCEERSCHNTTLTSTVALFQANKSNYTLLSEARFWGPVEITRVMKTLIGIRRSEYGTDDPTCCPSIKVDDKIIISASPS